MISRWAMNLSKQLCNTQSTLPQVMPLQFLSFDLLMNVSPPSDQYLPIDLEFPPQLCVAGVLPKAQSAAALQQSVAAAR